MHANIYIYGEKTVKIGEISDSDVNQVDNIDTYDYNQLDESSEFQSPISKVLVSTAKDAVSKTDQDLAVLKRRTECYNNNVKRVQAVIGKQLDMYPIGMVEEFWDKFISNQNIAMELPVQEQSKHKNNNKSGRPSHLATSFISKKFKKKH